MISQVPHIAEVHMAEMMQSGLSWDQLILCIVAAQYMQFLEAFFSYKPLPPISVVE